MGGTNDTVGRVGLDPNGFTSTTATLRRRQGQGEGRHRRDGRRQPPAEDVVTINGEPEGEEAPVVPHAPSAHVPEVPPPQWDRAKRF